MDLELDPFRKSCRSRQTGETHSFGRSPSAARIGQKKEALRIDEIENVRERVVFSREIGAPKGHGHDFSSARDQRVPHQFVRAEFSRAHKKARGEFAAGDYEFGRLVGHRRKRNTTL